MRRASILFAVVLSLVPGAAWPQGQPLGPEFRVNTYTTSTQALPSVAVDASGNFVVVWQSDLGGTPSNIDVFGQRYASSGEPLGPEFRINTHTTGIQFDASVAAGPSGDFVVAWCSAFQDGSSYGVFGQRYASSGTPLGPEFRVNTYTTNPQGWPSVAADSSGNFIVAWHSIAQVGPTYGVFGQRFAPDGAPLGPEFQVNTHTTVTEERPSIASDAAGNFVVVWRSNYEVGSNSDVFGRRFASSGPPLGPSFRVNTYTTAYQGEPSVASDASGGFVVAWESSGQDGSNDGVFGQRYASSGAALGTEFRLNTYTTGWQGSPSVAADPSGNFVVAWQGPGEGGTYGIFAQRYTSDGVPIGGEFRVNSFTAAGQLAPSVATDSSGDFVVIWESLADQQSHFDIFGQRFGQIVPVELLRFGVE